MTVVIKVNDINASVDFGRADLNFNIDSFKMSGMSVRVKIFPHCDEMSNFFKLLKKIVEGNLSYSPKNPIIFRILSIFC